MARISPILRSLARVVIRDLRSLESIGGMNNFFLFAIVLLQQPQSAVFLWSVAGLVLFFPLSSDPLKKIPEDRLALFPLTQMEHVALRIASIFLSPAVWLVMGILLLGGWKYRMLSLELLGLMIVANGLAFWMERWMIRLPALRERLMLPEFPTRLGGLVRKNIREMLHVLDPYAGLAMMATGAFYRFVRPNPEPDGVFGITMLTVLAVSTYGQQLFALDWHRGLARYRLMPVAGWEMLLAKDVAFLMIMVPLIAPLAVVPGVAAAFAVLASGHPVSIVAAKAQARWRFIAGGSFAATLMQTIAMFGAGSLTYRGSTWVLAVCAMIWVVSLFGTGWYYDRRLQVA